MYTGKFVQMWKNNFCLHILHLAFLLKSFLDKLNLE